MKTALVGSNINRLVDDVLRELSQAEALQPLLNNPNVYVGDRSRCEYGLLLQWRHKHRGSHHFIKCEGVRHYRPQSDQGVGENRQRLAGCAADALCKPAAAPLASAIEFKRLNIKIGVFLGVVDHS